MKEELKNKYPINTFSGETQREILELIQSEIDLALAEERKRIVEVIKSNSKGSFSDDANNACWYADELIDLITNK